MGKFLKGIFKFTVAAAAVGGVCYAFKDQIKQSKFYQEYDVDDKINKVKTTIKEKMNVVNDEADIVDEDEIFFDDSNEDEPRDYVSLDQEVETAESDDADDDANAAPAANA